MSDADDPNKAWLFHVFRTHGEAILWHVSSPSDNRACLERLSTPAVRKMVQIAGRVMLQRLTVAVRTFGKVLVEVDSAADEALRAAIRILTFCFARWFPTSAHLFLRAKQCLHIAYCDNLWFHGVPLVSYGVGRDNFGAPDSLQCF